MMRARYMELSLIFWSLSGCSSPSATETINFITQKPSDAPSMTALHEGTLRLRERCLYLEGAGNSHAIIWPGGYSYSTSAEGISVEDARGRTVVRVGEPLQVGGGEVPQPSAEVFGQNYLGDGPCRGTHWVLSSVEAATP